MIGQRAHLSLPHRRRRLHIILGSELTNEPNVFGEQIFSLCQTKSIRVKNFQVCVCVPIFRNSNAAAAAVAYSYQRGSNKLPMGKLTGDAAGFDADRDRDRGTGRGRGCAA